jgi:hypothetical protein
MNIAPRMMVKMGQMVGYVKFALMIPIVIVIVATLLLNGVKHLSRLMVRVTAHIASANTAKLVTNVVIQCGDTIFGMIQMEFPFVVIALMIAALSVKDVAKLLGPTMVVGQTVIFAATVVKAKRIPFLVVKSIRELASGIMAWKLRQIRARGVFLAHLFPSMMAPFVVENLRQESCMVMLGWKQLKLFAPLPRRTIGLLTIVAGFISTWI